MNTLSADDGSSVLFPIERNGVPELFFSATPAGPEPEAEPRCAPSPFPISAIPGRRTSR